MFKNLTSFASLLTEAHRIPQVVQQSHEKLERESIVGEAGGGAVRVTVNGLGETKQVELAPALISSGDVRATEQLILEALRQANSKTRERIAVTMREAATELNLKLPGIEKMLEKLAGGSVEP